MRKSLFFGLVALVTVVLWTAQSPGVVEPTSLIISKIDWHGYGAALAAVAHFAEPLGLSIADVAAMTSELQWTVKQKLRSGVYRAKKSGRRTIIIYQSVKEAWANLPEAEFLAPRRRVG